MEACRSVRTERFSHRVYRLVAGNIVNACIEFWRQAQHDVVSGPEGYATVELVRREAWASLVQRTDLFGSSGGIGRRTRLECGLGPRQCGFESHLDQRARRRTLKHEAPRRSGGFSTEARGSRALGPVL